MDLQLTGKRALVTGSNSGIGRAIAISLANEGVQVVVHGRRKKETEEVMQEILDHSGQVRMVIGDLTDDDQAQEVAQLAQAAFGGIDILVANAGAFPPTPILESTAQDWLNLYDQNVGSIIRLLRFIVPSMVESGWGRVITLGSIAASRPFASFGAYATTKSACVSLAVTIAKEFAGTGVTANCISPGDVITPAAEQHWRTVAKRNDWADEWEKIESHVATNISPTLVGRLGRPEEIADLVTFLASPKSNYINGSNFRIDGGFLASTA
ncbi:3-oxoacyl-[acyl-carrier-protein] reductase FabG [Photorhabdus australis subsp. thailandensis]|uniref:3-oxoacyl-[acyl-carrier-protein] reductase FabG n=1 Tax=Photorhabdus australis subsp. thailandensis TaxID=2805096 RepID=A0A1C0U285_9GAMM|nr:SDR family oxidoreductase [Photorhabdus australis]OCQ51995.1 3-oxoacyl-[acyl-carrier-protein] reductase FabG [Photorhabdus australis subsp. thailandensis]